MRPRARLVAAAVVAAVLVGPRAHAQSARPPAADDVAGFAAGVSLPRAEPRDRDPSGPGLRGLSIAKWTVLGATLVAAGYGLHASSEADSRYERIGRTCDAEPARCAARTPDNVYADPELARLEQAARRLDRSARLGLIAAQAGALAAVALFLLDLRETGAPPNVPYDPASLRVGLAPGGAFRLRLSVPAC